MITLLFWLASAAITALLYFSCPALHLAWILPLLIGFFLAFCILFVVYLEISSFFLPKDPPKDKPRPYAFHTIRLALPWFITLLGTRIRVTGREKLPAEPTIFVCNHRSAFDPVFMICGFKRRKMGFVSKASVLKYPFIGPYMNSAACVFIDRDSPMQSMRAIHRAAGYVKNAGIDYGIFPEGTRTKNGLVGEFKSGAFVAAKKAGAPIVLMTIEGSESFMKSFPFGSPKVLLTVREVISKEEMNAASAEELAKLCENKIKAALGEMPVDR
jgi:1-acyl-sn-glycerol-3-phosphate acyltransferase